MAESPTITPVATTSQAVGDAIDVRNLNKYYGPRHALQDVTFSVRKGEVLGFLGPNGAGKTTTMRILTGYMPATSGVARVAGFDTFTQSLQVREHIGYLPESVPLYTDMSVRDYLTFVARLHHVKHTRDAVDRAMERVNIEERENQLIGKLSKGFKQRVGIAQAIVHEPDVLVLDEPTIGLDPKQIIEVRNLIKELGREHTIVLSTHILPEVSQVCSRVVIISNGRIVAEDTPEQLTARLRGAERVLLQVLHPKPDIPEQLLKIDGVLNVVEREGGGYEVETALNTDRRAEIAALSEKRGWGILELRPIGMSLEDVFLKLTTSDTPEDEEEYEDEDEEEYEDEDEEEYEEEGEDEGEEEEGRDA